jgi:replication-associated recombination protein RarA
MVDEQLEMGIKVPTNGKTQTPGGYERDQVVSALQKAIRRGEEEAALYWALELGGGPYCWRRLAVIAAEDVGLANPMAVVVVNACWGLYSRARGYGEEAPLQPDAKPRWVDPKNQWLAMVVMFLCRSPKSRDVDDFLWTVEGERQLGKRLEIPDHALDGHTKAGRAMGRGDDFFYEVSSQLDRDEGGHEYRERVQEVWREMARCKKGK